MTEEQDGRMSPDEAIAMLKAGKIKEWNEYRTAHTDWRPLLWWADFGGANLSQADFTGANLIYADLRKANLRDTNFRRADLGYADFTGANLVGAIFIRAILYKTDLSRAGIGYTSFGGNDLSEVKGLDTVVHVGPSYVDTYTLLESQVKIPKSFLLGCGMPDGWIDYLPSLIGMLDPWQHYSCFISHSSKDQTFADKLYHAMIEAKVRVWYAPEDMRGGRKSHEQIDQAIWHHDKLLIVLSAQSIDSEWVRLELRWARKKEIETGKRVLFPIRLTSMDDIRAWKCLDDTGKDLAVEVGEYHIPDFREWENDDAFAREFDRLIDDLKADEQLQPEKSK